MSREQEVLQWIERGLDLNGSIPQRIITIDPARPHIAAAQLAGAWQELRSLGLVGPHGLTRKGRRFAPTPADCSALLAMGVDPVEVNQ